MSFSDFISAVALIVDQLALVPVCLLTVVLATAVGLVLRVARKMLEAFAYDEQYKFGLKPPIDAVFDNDPTGGARDVPREVPPEHTPIDWEMWK